MIVVSTPLASSDPTCGWKPADSEVLVIALVNNMPDGALSTTERQFRALLSVGSAKHRLDLRLFSLPDVPRSEAARTQLMQQYHPISELLKSQVDGLIVTGAEPTADRLCDESCWSSLTQLIDWARGHTISAIWSCFAAHATVHHLDGIDRHKLPRKLSGVFDCEMINAHALVEGLPQRWAVPHSRYNGLSEDLLESGGYRVLSRSDDAGADLFIKQCGSLFIFLQGHPEYYADALYREYRRDVVRYLTGERELYPEAPQQYFDGPTQARLDAFRCAAKRRRNLDIMPEFPVGGAAGPHLADRWNEMAKALFSNWVSYLEISRTHKFAGPSVTLSS